MAHATQRAAYHSRVKFVAALALWVPLAAQATIYKWTDEDGRVVIANHAPEPGARNVFLPQLMPEDFIRDTATPLLLRPREFLANARDLVTLRAGGEAACARGILLAGAIVEPSFAQYPKRG